MKYYDRETTTKKQREIYIIIMSGKTRQAKARTAPRATITTTTIATVLRT